MHKKAPHGLVFLALIVLALSASFGARAYAEDSMAVKAEGFAPKSESAAVTKKTAVEAALKGAVTQALSAIIEKEAPDVDPASLGEEVLSKPERYVLNYKILSEGWEKREIAGAAPQPEGWGAPEGDGPQPGEGPQLVDVYVIRVEATIDARSLRAVIAKAASTMEGIETEISLVITDIADYNAYSAVKSALARTPLVKDVSYDSFTRGRIVLKVRTSGGAKSFKQRLEKDLGAGFAVLFGGPQTITVTAVH